MGKKSVCSRHVDATNAEDPLLVSTFASQSSFAVIMKEDGLKNLPASRRTPRANI